MRERGVKNTVKNVEKKNTGTFIINIKSRHNATWQGTITWADENKVQNFRSALELLTMIDGALDENDTEKGGQYE